MEFWAELLGCLSSICEAVGYTPESDPTHLMTYDNVNAVETIELGCYDILHN